ncbi:MAG: PEP-CTERM sorting domain-containing protein [Gammaproteobacteria bacterium]|nr:PEP-CTERM sorting domain-containing protein [Gammaproteobacteria bacterium]
MFARTLLLMLLVGLSFGPSAYGIPLNVLWDDSHDNDGDELNGNFSGFRDIVVDEGHTIRELNGTPGSLMSSALSTVDLLVLTDLELAFTGSEITAVSEFVLSGGFLFVVGEQATSFNTGSHNSLFAALGSGVVFNQDDDVVSQQFIVPDALTAGISEIAFGDPGYPGGSVSVTGPHSRVLARESATGRVGYALGRDGQLLVLTDSSALGNGSAVGGRLPLNQQLVRNMLSHFEDFTPRSVPAPSTLALMAIGLVGAGFAGRRTLMA